jgi:protein-S-isoprenylcysteine O-methyltransferase Ste14
MTTPFKPPTGGTRSPWQWTVLAILVVSGVVVVLEIADSVRNLAQWKSVGGEGSWPETIVMSAVWLIGYAALAFWADTRRQSGCAIMLAIGALLFCGMMWIGQRA